MPIKGIFTGNDKHDNTQERIHQLEKEVKRINSLDVNMKRFLSMEGKLRTLMHGNNAPKSKPVKPEPGWEREDSQPDILKQVKSLISYEVNQQIKKWDNHQKQLQSLQNEIIDLKDTVAKQQAQIETVIEQIQIIKNQAAETKKGKEQPVVYQDITVERMMIDKYEMNNNIPHLGVKELSGFLNIGATYGRGIIPDDLAEDFKKGMDEFKKEKQSKEEEESDENEESSDAEYPSEEEEFTEIKIDD
ncbi:hypothetical protein CN378_05060 [Bacillus sp. AFS015802]|uniref:hypothetical protein n=1 Tax=Bacillus sp. AFS015802 TaxID=2033486 RepID=UPI000BF89EBC|nr:hypothetical protein [Bacillus sp. AFS015802]PFA69245.1 hypothetical protein CN378_05060 [Bacillus sp. AFS015802]